MYTKEEAREMWDNWNELSEREKVDIYNSMCDEWYGGNNRIEESDLIAECAETLIDFDALSAWMSTLDNYGRI